MIRYSSVFIIFLVITGIINCKSSVDKTVRLSQVKQFCPEPQESYPLRVVGVPFVLSVYEKCASHNELLVVSWASEAEYYGLETTAAKLVVGAYARFKSTPTTKCMPNHLNIDTQENGDNIITSFHTMSCNQRNSHPRPQLEK